MLRNGGIIEVTNPDQAKIAESAGASCIVVSDLFQRGRISRMPTRLLSRRSRTQSRYPSWPNPESGISWNPRYLNPLASIISMRARVPFVCGCKDLGEAMRRIREDEDEVFAFSKKISAPYDIVAQTKQMGRLPVVHFAAGGIVTPADAALMMQLGCDGVFIGQEVFRCSDPYKRVRAIVEAVRNYNDPHVLAEMSCGLEEDMAGLNLDSVEGTLGTY
ncbi:hypothetical protein C3L33_00265, partial [Rhododendron williamsianum]